MNKQPLEKYAELKNFSKALAVQVKEAEQKVLGVIKRAGFDSVKIEVGNFSIVQYKTWQYSQTVTRMEAMLKLAQATERNDGTAKVIGETEGVRFTPSKESNG